MRRNDIKQLHHKTKEELHKEVHAVQSRLTKMELERKTKPEKNFRLAQHLRDDIARIKTVLQLILVKEKTKV